MKPLPILLSAISAVLLSSCVEPYYGEEYSRHTSGPIVVDRQPVVVDQRPVVVERHRYREEAYPVAPERYQGGYPRQEGYPQSRPYYGDPVPDSSYERTTTRTYQGY